MPSGFKSASIKVLIADPLFNMTLDPSLTFSPFSSFKSSWMNIVFNISLQQSLDRSSIGISYVPLAVHSYWNRSDLPSLDEAKNAGQNPWPTLKPAIMHLNDSSSVAFKSSSEKMYFFDFVAQKFLNTNNLYPKLFKKAARYALWSSIRGYIITKLADQVHFLENHQSIISFLLEYLNICVTTDVTNCIWFLDFLHAERLQQYFLSNCSVSSSRIFSQMKSDTLIFCVTSSKNLLLRYLKNCLPRSFESSKLSFSSSYMKLERSSNLCINSILISILYRCTDQ